MTSGDAYTYTTNDQVATTLNARGVTTTVAYNNRNLVTGVTYSDPTPASTYTYDNYGATTYQWDGANRLKSVNGGTSGSYGFDGRRRANFPVCLFHYELFASKLPRSCRTAFFLMDDLVATVANWKVCATHAYTDHDFSRLDASCS